MTIETIGWVASILFALCGLPLAWKAYKTKKSEEPWSFLIMWFVGEVLMQIYVLVKHGLDLPLLTQYWANTIFLLIVIYYKLRSSDEEV
jgi:uncharacterized protein with PQ loop repeat